MSNPIQQAIEALEDILNGWKYIRDFHGDLYGVGWDRAQDKAESALTSLRALQKEVEGVELPPLPEPVHKAECDGMTWPEAFDADQMHSYARTAVAAALGRGVVNSGWCVTSEELAQWTDAYAAFKGAFDTPQMRRQFNDEYAEDSRHRLREFNERMLSAAPSPEATQPATDVDLINRGCRHQTDLLTVATQPTQAEAASVTTLQTVDELIAYAAQEREKDAEWQQWVERGGYDGDQQTEAQTQRLYAPDFGPCPEISRGDSEAAWSHGCLTGYRAALATQQAGQGGPVAQCTDTFGCACPKHYTATPPAPGQVERDMEDADYLCKLVDAICKDVLGVLKQYGDAQAAIGLMASRTKETIRAARSSEGGGQ